MFRPDIHLGMDPNEFLNNYYLKSELIDFCRKENISSYGRKPDITERISHYLKTGEKIPVKREIRSKPPETFTLETIIEENITCSDKHRTFFKSQIGEGFKYNVEFLNWLRENPGRTYADAVEQFRCIAEYKKNNKTRIGKQFEYNTYIRDFFDSNSDLRFEDAVKCWNYKKNINGHNRYEDSDKIVLEKNDDNNT